jgi:hypothetical protein
MKKYFAFAFLVTFLSCKKGEINYDEIVYTDGNGDIISVGNNNDWQVINSDNSVNFTQLDNGLSSFLNNVYGYNFEFNQNCTTDSVFESIVFYPNPVTKSETPRIRIVTNKPILNVAYSYKKIGGNLIGANAGVNNEFFTNLRQRVDFPFTGLIDERKNMEVFLAILTEDSCIYYAKGKVFFF